jgi:membrane-associated phospholipid phosphatase
LKEIIKNNRPFLIPYLIFLVSGIMLFLAFTKEELHLFLNQYHSKPLDVIFHYTTWLGEFIPPLTFGILFLFVRYRYTLMLLFGNLLSVLVTQTMKHTYFSDVVRPPEFFRGTDKLKFVEGVESLFYNSFPSGHTTCAFTTFFCLALITSTPLNKLLFFLIALAVGYSRVYLSQHFFNDIYAGSLVGFTSMFIVYYFMQRSQRSWLDKKLSF